MSEEQPQSQGAGGAGRVLNEDGTTNWTVVFDDPHQGILPAVRAVGSEAQLRAVMDQVAQLLFKRKRDEGPRAAFKAHIDAIIENAGDAGFEAARDAVLTDLEKEKNIRIQKALLHIKNKRASQSIERRRDEKAEGPFAFIVENPLFVGGGIAAVLAAITVVLLLVVLPGSIDTGEEKEPKYADTESAKNKPGPKMPNPGDTGNTPMSDQDRKADAPKPKMVEMIAFKPVFAEVLVDGQRRRASFVPFIGMNEDSDITLLCSLSPRVVEGILIMMQAATAEGKPMTKSLTREIAGKIAEDINSRSKLVKIDRIVLKPLSGLPRELISAANRGCERVDIDLNS
ncbi:MAG: hypothetical protein ACFE0S_13210 [Rhodospirillales bacterium]